MGHLEDVFTVWRRHDVKPCRTWIVRVFVGELVANADCNGAAEHAPEAAVRVLTERIGVTAAVAPSVHLFDREAGRFARENRRGS